MSTCRVRSDLVPKAFEAVKVRALFVSDVHLGTRGCQAELLLEFLNYYHSDQIYLVGDIIDGWRLKSRWYWPRSHNSLVAAVLAKVRAGARVLYIPGNHDSFLRGWRGTSLAGIEVVDESIHYAADGRRYLVLHGDRFDLVATYARWLALLGDAAYAAALAANTWFNRARRGRGLPYWSLSAWAKLKVKNVVNFIGDFESLVAAEARRLDVQGVICGYIHHATMHDGFGVRYINTGDWVESCTAVVEHFDGRFEIVRWPDPIRDGRLKAETVRLGAAPCSGRAIWKDLAAAGLGPAADTLVDERAAIAEEWSCRRSKVSCLNSGMELGLHQRPR
jgi:UDP-2,3-diacylglucosamine pyrophosphatase LpxH